MGLLSKLFRLKKNINQNREECADYNSNEETIEIVTENMKKYMNNYTQDDQPGWDAIDLELKNFYEDNSERHYGTIVKYMFGGEDPIDGFSIYDNEEQLFHRHIVSYGMSELYYDPKSADNEFSKWGFEFTMRVVPYEDDTRSAENLDGTLVENEPYWVMSLMQNLAKYVFDTGKWFDDYHFIPTNSPIRIDSDTKLVGVAFVPDTKLNTISTPNGEVKFLQLVGLTQKELDWLWENPKTYQVEKLIDRMREDNPLLIVDLNRKKEYVD